MHIPDDVSIVSTDGGDWGESLDVALSTVCIDQELRAEATIGEIIRLIEKRDSKTRNIVIPTKFINRDSVKPRKNNKVLQ
ncbi:MAG: substrate-binding domain-containing protein [Victivallales bacterium]|nr:substrate-binding domain-containing protein [Victivallales bacterium]